MSYVTGSQETKMATNALGSVNGSSGSSAQSCRPLVTSDVNNNSDTGCLESDRSNDFAITAPKKLKWSTKCGPPLKPKVTKQLDFNKVTVKNSTPFDVYSETCMLETLVNLTVTESNRYAEQQGQEYETTSEEVKAFFGILLLMGYHCLPSTRNYWSTDDDLQVPFITKVMTLKRFEALKRFLHFNDNAETPEKNSPDYDRA
jgi:hypothetical protein